MKRLIVVAMRVALAGCNGLMQGPQMDAASLKAVASDSNANAVNVTYTGAGGQGVYRAINTDKGSLGTNGGSATIKPDGEITITVNPRAAPADKPAAPVVAKPPAVPQ